jgi:hypothetical protein
MLRGESAEMVQVLVVFVVFPCVGEELTIECSQLRIRLKALGTEHPDVTASNGNMALAYKTQGNFTKAIKARLTLAQYSRNYIYSYQSN